jgi:hypothetical protein
MTTGLDCTLVSRKKFFTYWRGKFKEQRERKKVEEII